MHIYVYQKISLVGNMFAGLGVKHNQLGFSNAVVASVSRSVSQPVRPSARASSYSAVFLRRPSIIGPSFRLSSKSIFKFCVYIYIYTYTHIIIHKYLQMRIYVYQKISLVGNMFAGFWDKHYQLEAEPHFRISRFSNAVVASVSPSVCQPVRPSIRPSVRLRIALSVVVVRQSSSVRHLVSFNSRRLPVYLFYFLSSHI